VIDKIAVGRENAPRPDVFGHNPKPQFQYQNLGCDSVLALLTIFEAAYTNRILMAIGMAQSTN
jgi:hypothetical protein